MAIKLPLILAAAAVSIGSGCIERECVPTYFFDAPRVTIENNLGGRVDSIKLELPTDQRVYVPPEHRGIPIGTNISIYCAPADRNGNPATSGCVDGRQFEFFFNYTDIETGSVEGFASENRGGFDIERLVEEFELSGNAGGDAITCIVLSPKCATAGFRYTDEYGRERFQETAWRPRTLVGIAEAYIITEMLCPAPLPAFRPVDEDEWRPSSENEL